MKGYDPLKVLSQNLTALKAREGMSQDQLAIKSGVSQKTVSNALRATHPITILNLQKLAQIFGYSAWELLTPNLLDKQSAAAVSAAFIKLDDHYKKEVFRHFELISRDSGASKD